MAKKKDAKINIVGTNQVITNSDDLVSFTIQDDIYSNNSFIGSVCSKEITLEILNDDNSYDLENAEICVYVQSEEKTGNALTGALTIDLVTPIQYLSYGNYILEKSTEKEVAKTITYRGYDYMQKFNVAYEDVANTYPKTLLTLLQEVCSQCNVTLGSNSFVNSSYTIAGNPFTNGESCKKVISSIAELAGGYAHIGRDNKLYISNLDVSGTPVDTITSGEYLDTAQKQTKVFGEVNFLAIGLSQVEGEVTIRKDDSSIAQYGQNEIRIMDNYFMTNSAQRELVIDNIWNAVKGLTYLPINYNYYGFPYLDAGDCIKLVNTEEDENITYVLQHRFKYTGGFEGNITSEALSQTQTAYQDISTFKGFKRNTEIKVDKINGEITSINAEIGDGFSSTSTITQKTNELSTRISSIEGAYPTNITTQYFLSSSPLALDPAPTTQDGWLDYAPVWNINRPYMWTRTKTTNLQNQTSYSTPQYIVGYETGKTIPYYCISQSASTEPTSGWSPNKPTFDTTTGTTDFIWVKYVTTNVNDQSIIETQPQLLWANDILTTTLTQTDDRIELKAVNKSDVTIEVEGTAGSGATPASSGIAITEDIAESEPILIKIHPNSTTDITALYPSTTLKPNNSLFPHSVELAFYNTSLNTKTIYELPCDLYYLSDSIYDEFVIDYENQKCYKIKRITYSPTTGNKTETTTQIIDYDYPTIKLDGGKYRIYIEHLRIENKSCYIQAKLMKKNDWTSQTTTRVEQNSTISQTASNILTEVSETYNGTELVSRINQTADAVSINANKINLNGVVTANEHFKITEEGDMECHDAKIYGDIYLSGGDRTQVISNKGLMTNLHFENSGGYLGNQLSGYNFSYGGLSVVGKIASVLYANIPQGFSIEHAYITFVSQGVPWQDVHEHHYSGTDTNRHFYTGGSFKIDSNYMQIGSEMYASMYNVIVSEGQDLYNQGFSTGVSGTSLMAKTINIDLKDKLGTGLNTIYCTSGKAVADVTLEEAYSLTCAEKIILDVYGYMQF